MAGSHAREETGPDEPTRQMAGGGELDRLGHELARTRPSEPGGGAP
ncbi:hypothetical protein [Streptomyces sp. CNQ085]